MPASPPRLVRTLLATILLCAVGCGGSSACPTTLPSIAPTGAVAFDSADGRALLARNATDADLGPLLAHFESQQHRAHCGVTSSVIALNALRIDAETPANLAPFHYHTQATFFDRAEVSAVVPAERVAERGMTLDQLGGLLAANGVEARVTHGADSTLETFRASVRANVEREGDLVLLNYHRPGVGQEGGGHISPIAAYDESTDRMLILDVARYRYGPVWFPTDVVFGATQAVDSDSGLSRGWVEVARRP